MTGAALFTAVILFVLVAGTYLVQAAILILRLCIPLLHVAFVLLCGVVWCGWLVVRPREAMASLRQAMADAEAESAIRRLNRGLA